MTLLRRVGERPCAIRVSQGSTAHRPSVAIKSVGGEGVILAWSGRSGDGSREMRARRATTVVMAASLAALVRWARRRRQRGDTTPPAPFDFVADAGDYQTGYAVASPYSNIYVTWQERPTIRIRSRTR